MVFCGVWGMLVGLTFFLVALVPHLDGVDLIKLPRRIAQLLPKVA